MCVDKLGSEKLQKATKAVARNWLQAAEVLRRGDINKGPGQIYEEKGNSTLYRPPKGGMKHQGTEIIVVFLPIFKLKILEEIIFFWHVDQVTIYDTGQSSKS